MPLFEQGNARWLSSLWGVREVDQLLARFGRYTRFVVYSKWSLLLITALLMVILIAWPLVTKNSSGLRVSFVDIKAAGKKAASPVMNNPEYRGVGANGQQYKVNGKTATQQTENLVLIEAVEAQMLKEDGSWYSLSAERAEYQQDKKQIDLFGNVTVVDGKATTFTTSHAVVDNQQSRIYGDEEIQGSGALGNILASGFEITDNGQHIIFKGGEKQLRVTIERGKKRK